MSLADSLLSAASELIDKFGTSATLYSYSSATTSTNDEGEVTVSSWGDGTSIKVVAGEESVEALSREAQGIESVGNDQVIVSGDTSVSANDRLNMNNKDFRVNEIQVNKPQDVEVIKVLSVTQVNQTTNW